MAEWLEHRFLYLVAQVLISMVSLGYHEKTLGMLFPHICSGQVSLSPFEVVILVPNSAGDQSSFAHL